MKKIYLIFISFLFTTLLNAQSIDLYLGQENLTLNVPSTSSIDLEITPDNFSHQLFFTIEYSNLPESVEVSFSESSLTSPYEGGKLNIDVMGGTPDGEYEIYIKAYNGPVEDVDTCYITIESTLCGWNTYAQPEVPYPSNIFFDMAVDKENNFWIISANYLMKFNKESGYNLTHLDNLGASNLNKIVVDNEGNKWIYVLNQGLLRYDGSQSEIYTPANSPLPSATINDMMVDSKGVLWVATDKGLSTFDGSFWGLFSSSNSDLSSDTIISVTEDGNGKIWAVCDLWPDEIFQLEDDQWAKKDYLINCSFNLSAENIIVDSLDNIWLAAYNGIYKIDDNQIEFWEKNLYSLGRHDTYKLNTCEALTSTTDSPLHYLDLSGITEGENSEIWLTGTGDRYNTGLVLKYDGSWHPFDYTNSNLPKFSFRGVAADRDGKAWVMANHYSLTESYYYYYGNLINFECQEDVITNLYTETVDANKLNLYPNPSSEILNFDASHFNGETRVFITDIMGNKMEVEYEVSGSENGLVDIETINPGIYILTVESEEKSVSSRFCKR